MNISLSLALYTTNMWRTSPDKRSEVRIHPPRTNRRRGILELMTNVDFALTMTVFSRAWSCHGISLVHEFMIWVIQITNHL